MSDEQHTPSTQYECPRCRKGRLIKITDMPLALDNKFRCASCGGEFKLDSYPPVSSTGWGSNYEERN